MHSRNVWLILDATKSPQIRPWQQPSPRANLLELIDEAFTKHRQWRQTQDTSAYQTWAEASSYECNRASSG